MDKPEAESLYDSGKEPTVDKLLELDRENQALKIKIASLETNSTNSSKPPSSDGPRVVRDKQQQSCRKQGGQPGHLGKKRELLPVEEMDRIKHLYSSACAECSIELNPDLDKETSDPIRHQTFDIPDIELIKTEYRCHELECCHGHRTRAVQWRKICFGNQSEEGVYFTERILSVIRTCKLQGKNPFHFLTQVMDAAFNGTPRPSLI